MRTNSTRRNEYSLLRDDSPGATAANSATSIRKLFTVLCVGITIVAGCGKDEKVASPPVDGEQAAIEALIDMGADVKPLEDELLESGGILVTLYREHLSQNGLVLNEVLDHVRHLRTCLLGLNNTQITDAGLAPISKMPNVVALILSNTRISNAGLAHLRGMLQLRLLKLNLTRITDDGVAHLKGLNNLELLYLSNSRVSNVALEHLQGLKKLKALQVSGTGITDDGLQNLKNLTNIEFLGIDDNEITDDGLTHLIGLKKLKYLNVAGTRVTDARLNRFRQGLPELQFKR